MAKWSFETGHTSAEFCARHMMVTWVRGHFKDVHGSLEWDPARPLGGTVQATIDAGKLWSGEPDRDAHLKSADFLDVQNHPTIRFQGKFTDQAGECDFGVSGNLTLRGVTRPVELEVRYLGQWKTPWWVENQDLGPKSRAGFCATTRIRRQDFGVSWNGSLEREGVVVGDEILITLDVEAILEE